MFSGCAVPFENYFGNINSEWIGEGSKSGCLPR
ncbi:hypothetical protein DESC_580105 [Desulfosarcina cetonica]|nr:hypothetical protein DESC_580105 [Desulfosarcina cetonica]